MSINTGIKNNKVYRQVDLRDNGMCQRPGCRCWGSEKHHIIFRSQGGLDEEDNLVSLCPEHHKEAHSSPEWRTYWENWKPKKFLDYY